MIDFVPPALLDAFHTGLSLAQAQAAPEAAASATDTVWVQQYLIVAAVIAVLVVPFVIGSYIAKAMRMPTYGTRIGAILLAITASVVVAVFGQVDYGVDIRGGTILVYEIDPKASLQQSADGQPTKVSAEALIPALTRRINPSGTQEIVLRPYGESQLEIIIPQSGDQEVQRIKDTITQAGILRFFIVANRNDHNLLIETATDRASSDDRSIRMDRRVINSEGRMIGYWADVDREEADKNGIRPLRVDVVGSTVRNPDTGRLVNLPPSLGGGDNAGTAIAQYLQQQGMRDLQVLMVVDEFLQITGEDLSFAARSFGKDGSPSVRFKLKDSGSARFLQLTKKNIPDPQTGFKRQLGIVLDDGLLSAPVINSPIGGEGTIEGRFSNKDVEFLVNILQAGQLPAALNKTPISENRIGSTLGADTIQKGLLAIGASLVMVLVFVLFYYRFAGFVACFALLMNLAMIYAMMILINQPVTLPGLAGMVLTVGMSVDANVLIFERIREETRKGAAARMAVRNGFDRATTTIVDANLTTLITAIVLYAIGTDQIRGFAVTLILGIIFSMFTAIYVSRTLFDIAERQKFLTLGMSDLVSTIRSAVTGNRDVDFMGKGVLAITMSTILIVIGVSGLVMRGSEILDIDFAGGSSVTFQLETPMPADQVRSLVSEHIGEDANGDAVQFTLNRVDVETAAPDTVYKIDATFGEDEELKQRLAQTFAATDKTKLITYHVEISAPGESVPATGDTGAIHADNGTQLVAAWQEEQPPAGDAPAADPTTEPAPAEQPAGDAVTSDTPAGEEPAADVVASEPADGDQPAADVVVPGVPGSTDQDPPVIEERITSVFNVDLSIDGSKEQATLNYEGLRTAVMKAAETAGVILDRNAISAEPQGNDAEAIAAWTTDSSLSFSSWRVTLDLPGQPAAQVMGQLTANLDADPVWLSSSEISSRVAGEMIQRALAAMFASLLFIVGYIWFRFQRVAFGVAAVVALVHDVLITLGAIAVSYWLAGALGFIGMEEFKISLTVVAALLTIVGYSLNDTIVVFDRIREVRGKSPRLTSDMINVSINQTLSRTLLTSITTLIVVVLLYFFGGSGIHAFAFSLVVGVVVGTYSSIFIASPILLWLVAEDRPDTGAMAPRK